MKDFYEKLKKQGYPENEIFSLIEQAPLQAHTNRGEASLIIYSDQSSYADLYKILDRSTSILRELLSGEDENHFVRQSHLKGQFCEDITREILFNVVDSLKKKVSPDTLIWLLVDVDESVHHHNLFSSVMDTFQNIQASLIS